MKNLNIRGSGVIVGKRERERERERVRESELTIILSIAKIRK